MDAEIAVIDPAGENLQQGPQAPQHEPPRIRRTHTTAVIIKLLKSLPLMSILQRNKEIETRNATRSLKTLNHHLDPDTYPEPGSETASLISIDPEDRARLKVPSFLSSVSEHMYPSLAKWIADEELSDREVAATATSLKRKAGDEKSLAAVEALEVRRIESRRHMDGSKIVPYVVGVPWTVRFPQSLFDTEDCVSVPLPFFLNKHLRILISEASTLPTVKSNPKPGETKGISILDVEKLTVRFGKELSLDASQWGQAANNMILFQMERDKDGENGNHAKWFALHFDYFNTLEKRDELYEAWKHVELKFRQDHWATYGAYVPEKYEAAFALAEKEAEMTSHFHDMMAAAISSSKAAFTRNEPFSFKNSQKPSRPRFPDRQQSSSSSQPQASSSQQPFPSGSGKSPSNADCLVCGERGHDSRIHNNQPSPPKFKDGKPTWSKTVDRNLVGGNNHTLCIPWNLRGDRGPPCHHGKEERFHLCSLCGSKDHYAFSWTCQPNPRNV